MPPSGNHKPSSSTLGLGTLSKRGYLSISASLADAGISSMDALSIFVNFYRDFIIAADLYALENEINMVYLFQKVSGKIQEVIFQAAVVWFLNLGGANF